MRYFTESYFRNITDRLPVYEQRMYGEKYHRAAVDTQFDVFLSYNISDLNVVKGIYYALSKLGLSVYLDCIVDPDMKRDETDKETAKKIRSRLIHSKSLIYAQSPDAANSNWMPWELGVVDGHTSKCMIMPVNKDAKPVSPKREYLLLYPYIMSYGLNEIMKVITDPYLNIGEDITSFIKK